MADESTSRRLRGAVRNAVVWGVTWGALGTTYASLRRLADGLPFLNAIGDGLGMGIRIGIVGGLTGAAFATFVSVAYRNRRLAEISALRFGLAGAVIASVFVLLFMQGMNVLSGDSVPWSLITDDLLMAALFGGVTAAGTMAIAQRNETSFASLDDVRVSSTTDPDPLRAGDATAFQVGQRTGVEERRSTFNAGDAATGP